MKTTNTDKFFNKEVITKITLDHAAIPSGTYFTASIDGKICRGLVYNDVINRCLYFCQNSAKGNSSPNKLGYLHSWSLRYGVQPINNNITSLKFPTPPKGFKKPLILPQMAGHTPEILKGKVKFGCQEVSNKDIRTLVKHLKD